MQPDHLVSTDQGGPNMSDDELLELAQRIGLRDAGRYLAKTGRYPSPDDTDDHGSAAWSELEKQGSGDGDWDARSTSWQGGYLGPRA
jgi:hypothetical protein